MHRLLNHKVKILLLKPSGGLGGVAAGAPRGSLHLSAPPPLPGRSSSSSPQPSAGSPLTRSDAKVPSGARPPALGPLWAPGTRQFPSALFLSLAAAWRGVRFPYLAAYLSVPAPQY